MCVTRPETFRENAFEYVTCQISAILLWCQCVEIYVTLLRTASGTSSCDDVMTCKRFPHWCPFVRGIHRWNRYYAVLHSFLGVFHFFQEQCRGWLPVDTGARGKPELYTCLAICQQRESWDFKKLKRRKNYMGLTDDYKFHSVSGIRNHLFEEIYSTCNWQKDAYSFYCTYSKYWYGLLVKTICLEQTHIN